MAGYQSMYTPRNPYAPLPVGSQQLPYDVRRDDPRFRHARYEGPPAPPEEELEPEPAPSGPPMPKPPSSAAQAGGAIAGGAALYGAVPALGDATGAPPPVVPVSGMPAGTSGIGPVASGPQYANAIEGANAPGFFGGMGSFLSGGSAPSGAMGTAGFYALPAAAGAKLGYETFKAISEPQYKHDYDEPGEILKGALSFKGPRVIGSWLGSGKGEQQQRRDTARDHVRSNTGMIVEGTDDTFKLPGDRTFAVRDLPFKSYNIDWDTANHDIVGQADALSLALFGPGGRDVDGQNVQSQIASEWYNVAMHGGGDPQENIRYMAQQAGRDPFELKHNIQLMWEAGDIDANERDSKFAAIDKTFGIINPNAPTQPETPQFSPGEKTAPPPPSDSMIPKKKEPLKKSKTKKSPFFY